MTEFSDGDIAEELNVKGLLCPEPVMCLHNAIKRIAPGECLRVLATDPSTARDIPRFCEFLGHELLRQEQDGELLIYLVRKKLAHSEGLQEEGQQEEGG